MSRTLTQAHKQVGPTLCPADQGQWSEVVLADSIQHYLIHGWHFFKSSLTWEDTVETVQHSIPLFACVESRIIMDMHLMCGILESKSTAKASVRARIHNGELSLSVLKYCNILALCSFMHLCSTSPQIKTDEMWWLVATGDLLSVWLPASLFCLLHMLMFLPLSCFLCCLQVKRRCPSMTARRQSVPSARCCSGPESSRNTWRPRSRG